jgi:hypothetical protein
MEINLKKIHIFYVKKEKRLCVSMKIFFQANGIVGFDGLNLCSSVPLYLTLYLQLNVYLVAICRQGSCPLSHPCTLFAF